MSDGSNGGGNNSSADPMVQTAVTALIEKLDLRCSDDSNDGDGVKAEGRLTDLYKLPSERAQAVCPPDSGAAQLQDVSAGSLCDNLPSDAGLSADVSQRLELRAESASLSTSGTSVGSGTLLSKALTADIDDGSAAAKYRRKLKMERAKRKALEELLLSRVSCSGNGYSSTATTSTLRSSDIGAGDNSYALDASLRRLVRKRAAEIVRGKSRGSTENGQAASPCRTPGGEARAADKENYYKSTSLFSVNDTEVPRTTALQPPEDPEAQLHHAPRRKAAQASKSPSQWQSSAVRRVYPDCQGTLTGQEGRPIATTISDGHYENSLPSAAKSSGGWWWIDGTGQPRRSMPPALQSCVAQRADWLAGRAMERQRRIAQASSVRRHAAALSRRIAQHAAAGDLSVTTAERLLNEPVLSEAAARARAFTRAEMETAARRRACLLPENRRKRDELRRQLDLDANRILAKAFSKRLAYNVATRNHSD